MNYHKRPFRPMNLVLWSNTTLMHWLVRGCISSDFRHALIAELLARGSTLSERDVKRLGRLLAHFS